ncbi:class I SAM-dependent DNA methyltransferase [Aurantimonas sp. HBX-1]|uniref:HsdM family class I SAM-dependent methyltransferase n=1 Tax=Aurantimonas sp. HBX-1 TaxID=2906072 RepID=UPI001F40C5BC|nr:N-6 DNA methylase [Aurantimonas sp. HBX-1]UIJ72399.1 SAM-dependent methyltransferase [Aurantimonas sp. HBX-1]
MNAVECIAQAARDIGYRAEAVVLDYAFADVLSDANTTRTVQLAAFTRTPPSYRSAALAVVNSRGHRAIDLVKQHRALGAPLLFVIEHDDVTVWEVRSDAPPRAIEKVTVTDIAELFGRNQANWHPDAIHRAKSIGASGTGYQLDFVDVGLLPTIESEIHLKLDRLLVETLDRVRQAPSGDRLDARTLFRVVFRLLAAKVLQDRRHPYADGWDANDLGSVLAGIESYYALAPIAGQANTALPRIFDAAWRHLQGGISFSNISSDDLAFVYENTLITPETRKLFGTHSTPRQVAEYVVQRLELHRHKPEDLRIYEPFAGAGVFLVSVLRHLRDLLPVEWSDQERHDFLIGHISGDEVDPFACEVATLSLILADYPNHNGWHVKEADLFADGVLAQRIGESNVIVCNPPFEAFSAADKGRYAVARETHSKAIAALSAAIDGKPLALGFVLPRSFILERQFAEQRRRIENLYSTVEILKLPDGIFGASDVETSAVIARDLRGSDAGTIALRSSEVAERDRSAFLKTGRATVHRELVRAIDKQPEGQLWIPPLNDLWDYLEDYPNLASVLKPSRGLEWTYHQDQATSENEKPGYRLGYANARHLQQYNQPRPLWLDFRSDHLRRGAAHDWMHPKLVASATRLSRGAWCIGAFVDTAGLLCSQQFFGLWPKRALAEQELAALGGVLNGPVANAYLAINSPKDRFRTSVVGSVPIPALLPAKLTDLVGSYLELLRNPLILGDVDTRLAGLLSQIDAAVLEAYDLPLRLERQLLAFFEGSERPVAHPWTHWNAAYPMPGLSLAERLSGRFNAGGDWVGKIFKPLPKEQALLLRDYVA